MLSVRVQARITLPLALRAAADAARLRWNPEAATGNPAHATVVYHDEAPDVALLQDRLAEACRALAPFRLVVGEARRFPPPVRGVFLAAHDPERGVARLRALVLRPPFAPRRRFGLHVTLLHPAQGERLEAAWPALRSLPAPGAFEVCAVELVSGSGGATETLAVHGLGGGRPGSGPARNSRPSGP